MSDLLVWVQLSHGFGHKTTPISSVNEECLAVQAVHEFDENSRRFHNIEAYIQFKVNH
jgi:hypothetical protein